MNRESGFIEFIKTITDLPSEQENKFKVLLSVNYIKKEVFFVKVGRISRNIAFVKKGLFRYFYTTEDGVEFTKGFFDSHSILSAYDAILENGPAHYSVQALEDSVIEEIDYEKFTVYFQKIPAGMNFWSLFSRKDTWPKCGGNANFY
ncbi:MAG: cyclic nucleotide-binding domain-containing protein [Balneolaceae bacterium]|nr:cyclic nucleotide-binding domain-containing protein [Balneolaceae bacterium]